MERAVDELAGDEPRYIPRVDPSKKDAVPSSPVNSRRKDAVNSADRVAVPSTHSGRSHSDDGAANSEDAVHSISPASKGLVDSSVRAPNTAERGRADANSARPSHHTVRSRRAGREKSDAAAADDESPERVAKSGVRSRRGADPVRDYSKPYPSYPSPCSGHDEETDAAVSPYPERVAHRSRERRSCDPSAEISSVDLVNSVIAPSAPGDGASRREEREAGLPPESLSDVAGKSSRSSGRSMVQTDAVEPY